MWNEKNLRFSVPRIKMIGRWMMELHENHFLNEPFLDFGAGYGRNSNFFSEVLDLEEDTFKVFAYEPVIDIKYHVYDSVRIIKDTKTLKKMEFGTVLCSFVMNILPKNKRYSVYRILREISCHNLIIVYGKGYPKKYTIPFEDGMLSESRGTFFRSYNHKRATEECRKFFPHKDMILFEKSPVIQIIHEKIY